MLFIEMGNTGVTKIWGMELKISVLHILRSRRNLFSKKNLPRRQIGHESWWTKEEISIGNINLRIIAL